MSTPAFEEFLARLYVEEKLRRLFLENPRREALRARLSEAESTALESIDVLGLQLAAESFHKKRQRKKG